MEHYLREGSSRAKRLLPLSYMSILKDRTRQTSPTRATKRIFDDLQSYMELISTPTTYCSSSSCTQSGETSLSSTKRRRLNPRTIKTPESEKESRVDFPEPIPPHNDLAIDYTTKSESWTAPKLPPPTVDNISWSLFSSKPLQDKPFLAADEISQDPTMIRAAYDRARQHAKSSNQLGECGVVFCPKSLESEEHIRKEIARRVSDITSTLKCFILH